MEELLVGQRAPQSKLEKRFVAFFEKNPQVYPLFDRFAAQLASKETKGGARVVWERLRWFVRFETADTGEFKLNDNYIAYYARLWMERNPQHGSFFRTRRLKNERVLQWPTSQSSASTLTA